MPNAMGVAIASMSPEVTAIALATDDPSSRGAFVVEHEASSIAQITSSIAQVVSSITQVASSITQVASFMTKVPSFVTQDVSLLRQVDPSVRASDAVVRVVDATKALGDDPTRTTGAFVALDGVLDIPSDASIALGGAT